MLKLPPLHNHEYHGNQRGTGRQERSAEKWLSTKRSQALLTKGGLRAQPPVPLLVGAGLQEGIIPSNLLSWWRLVDDSRKWDG